MNICNFTKEYADDQRCQCVNVSNCRTLRNFETLERLNLLTPKPYEFLLLQKPRPHI
jgi:hypothetical protein